MIRAAAKNFRDVLVVTSPSDYDRVLAALDETGGRRWPSDSNWQGGVCPHGQLRHGDCERARGGGRARRRMRARDRARPAACEARRRDDEHRTLRYGENPHQPAGWYVPADAGRPTCRPFSRARNCRSRTCWTSTPRAHRVGVAEPAAVVVKHTNPAACDGSSLDDAYVRARDADPLSAFAAFVGCNRESTRRRPGCRVDVHRGRHRPVHHRWGVGRARGEEELRVVIAPRCSARAPAVRLESAAWTCARHSAACSPGTDRVVELEEWPREAGPSRDEARAVRREWKALRFAWRVCAHVKSNTVIFTAHDRTLAVGPADEPRRRGQRGEDEGGVRQGAARRIGRGVRRVLPVPRRPRRGRRGGRDGRHSAGARCATRKSSRRPTSTASRWSSRAAGTSALDRSSLPLVTFAPAHAG